MGKVSESYKSLLKQNAMSFLPPELNSVETQRNVLFMVEAVAPTVSVCRKSAEEQLWPQVKSGELSIQEARKKCAVYLNRLASVTIVENLKLERHPKENLQKAWIAMDSYAQLLKPEESPKLRNLMDEIAAVIEMKETGKRPSANVQEMKTVAVDTSKVKIPDMKTVEAMKNAAAPSASKEAEEYTGYEEKRRNPATGVILLILVAVLAVVGITIAWKHVRVDKVEDAISDIGTVTMESSGAIKNAEVLYSELSEEQQAEVENHDVMVAARSEYNRLEKLIADAVAAIEDIGTVTLDSKDKIAKAQKAYAALEADGLTAYVEEEAKILTAAQEKFEKLYVEDTYTRGVTLYNQKNYSHALEKFSEIVTDYAKSGRVKDAKSYAGKCLLAQAQNSFNSLDYETTMNLLTTAKKTYGTSNDIEELLEKLDKKLDSIRPISGKRFGSDGIPWGRGTLTITAGSKDVLLKIISEENPAKFRMLYVRAEEKLEINLQDGEYKIQYSTGENWFSDKAGFGKDALYKEIKKIYTYTTVTEGSYRYYNALKLDFSASVSATDVTYEKFWEQ